MSIRTAESNDIPQMIQLLKLLFEIEADFEFNPAKHQAALTAIIDDDSCGALVATDENQTVVGMCMAQWVISTATGKKSAWMEDLVVLPEYRSCGVGKQLIEAIQQWAIDQGCNRIQLVYDLDNLPAIGFYQNQGFNSTRLGVFSKPI